MEERETAGCCVVFLLAGLAIVLVLTTTDATQPEWARYSLDVCSGAVGVFSARWEHQDGQAAPSMVGVLYQSGTVYYFRVPGPEDDVHAEANSAELIHKERVRHHLDVRPNVTGAFSACWEYLDGQPTTTVVGVLYQNGAVEYFRVSWPEEGVDAKASH